MGSGQSHSPPGSLQGGGASETAQIVGLVTSCPPSAPHSGCGPVPGCFCLLEFVSGAGQAGARSGVRGGKAKSNFCLEQVLIIDYPPTRRSVLSLPLATSLWENPSHSCLLAMCVDPEWLRPDVHGLDSCCWGNPAWEHLLTTRETAASGTKALKCDAGSPHWRL